MPIENSVVFLPCQNIEDTSEFYTKMIGLELVQEQAGGKCRIFDTGYGYWGFCEYGDNRNIPNGPKGVCLSLNCADEVDVDKQYSRLIEQKQKPLSVPKVQENFPVYAFFIEDPNGYKVEFQVILLPDQQLKSFGRNV